MDFLYPSEVAKIFRVNIRTVARWADTGRLPYTKTLGGHRRFAKEDVERLANYTPPRVK